MSKFSWAVSRHRGRILKDDPEPFADFILVVRRIKAVDLHLSTRRLQQRRQDFDGGCFSSTVGPQKGKDLARLDGK